MRFSRRKGPTGSVHAVRRTDRLGPRFNYELLTSTTLIYAIGAGITAAAGTRLALQLFLVKGFKLYSFQLQDPKEPCISIYCHYLPVSGLGNCAPAAFLGCSSRFSGSFSGVEPLPSVTRCHHGWPRPSRRKLIGQKFEGTVAGAGGAMREVIMIHQRAPKGIGF